MTVATLGFGSFNVLKENLISFGGLHEFLVGDVYHFSFEERYFIVLCVFWRFNFELWNIIQLHWRCFNQLHKIFLLLLGRNLHSRRFPCATLRRAHFTPAIRRAPIRRATLRSWRFRLRTIRILFDFPIKFIQLLLFLFKNSHVSFEELAVW